MRTKRHTETEPSTGLAAAHRTFGGLDLPAAVAGLLAAVGTTVVVGAAAGALAAIGHGRGSGTVRIPTAWVAGGVALLLVAFVVGGWVAGRMARFDGPRNGALAAVLFALVATGLAATGRWLDDKYAVVGQVHAPHWLTGSTAGARAVAVAVAAVVVVIGALLGGMAGGRYHRRVDRVVDGAGAPSDGLGLVTGDADYELERSEQIGRHAVR